MQIVEGGESTSAMQAASESDVMEAVSGTISMEDGMQDELLVDGVDSKGELQEGLEKLDENLEEDDYFNNMKQKRKQTGFVKKDARKSIYTIEE